MSEKKVASRNAVITLGIVCVILAVGLVGSVSNLEYQIQILKSQMNSDISRLQNQIDQLQLWLSGNITRFENQISLLNSKISSLQSWLDGNVTSFKTQIISLNSNITSLKSQISLLNSKIASLNSTIATLKSQMFSLNSTVITLQGQVALLNAKISVLTDPETGNAINYISNFMFVPSVGLDKEAPVAAPNTIWLTNDNFIVYAVLSKLDSSRADTIKQKLDFYGITGNGKVELFADRQVGAFRTFNYYNVDTVGSYTIKKEVLNGTVMLDFYNYTDLCFYWSKNLLLNNNVSGALMYFKMGMSKWNGTGFLDKTFYDEGSHKMETYKIGLALWMGRTLNITLNGQIQIPDYHKMENIIWSMQNSTNGGIYTHYVYTNGKYQPVSGSDTNTETTSICLLYKLMDIERIKEENIEYTIYSGCVKWIIDNFNETVSLVYETEPINGDRLVGGNGVMAEFWLHNGNFLASLSLNRDMPDLTSRIRSTFDHYHIPFGNQKFGWLLGNPIRFPPYDFSYNIVDSNLNISNEEWDNEQYIWRDWSNFSDWVAIKVMVDKIAGNVTGIENDFQMMISPAYFNRFAVNDSMTIVNGGYETFKQVLPIIVADQLGKNLPFRNTLVERLKGIQLPNGGMPYKFDLNGNLFNNSYDRRGNLEATALTAIALMPRYTLGV